MEGGAGGLMRPGFTKDVKTTSFQLASLGHIVAFKFLAAGIFNFKH